MGGVNGMMILVAVVAMAFFATEDEEEVFDFGNVDFLVGFFDDDADSGWSFFLIAFATLVADTGCESAVIAGEEGGVGGGGTIVSYGDTVSFGGGYEIFLAFSRSFRTRSSINA